jgi:hypothetical protein
MSRRDQITMSDDEVAAFLEEERVMTCATLGPRGWPHLMPLWYLVVDGGIRAWTFAKSQKAKNLERDPRATLQIEAGGAEYDQLRGVMLECDVALHRDDKFVEDVAVGLVDRYSGTGPEFDPLRDFFRSQVPKRMGLEFVERRRATWDHRKLGGAY